MARLIDGDALIAWIKGSQQMTSKMKNIICYIKTMPTIEARPKGEWIDRSDGGRILHPWWESHECNQCGYEGSGAWNFCPNCGADMRERKDFQVIVNGNCTKCGKPLSGNRIFICEECEEQSKESE